MGKETRGNNNYSASAREFVDNLLTEGSKVACDESNSSFDIKDIPPFYDEKLYKRGQDFYYKHLSALYVCKLSGLLAVLAIPSILDILKFTNMSGSAFTAYKRYMATMYHMQLWYDKEFQAGSKAWKSIKIVRNMHNCASRSGVRAGLSRISQKDMALTQFGFMGFAIARGDALGIYNTTEEELKSFIHIWRVIGYLFGIEDRFNICRESVEETREICELLIARVFRPLVEKKDKDFMEMCKHFTDGMWSFDMLISYKPSIIGLWHLLQEDYLNIRFTYIEANAIDKFLIYFASFLFKWMKYDIVRIYFNYLRMFQLWYNKYLPIVAICQYGYRQAIIDIKV